MLNITDIMETITMIQEENLDIIQNVNLTIDDIIILNEGNKVCVQVDNETPIRFTVPSSNDCYYSYYKATIGELNLTKGAHYISVIGEDEVRFHDVSYYLSSATHPLFEHSLNDYVLEGARYVNSWKIRDDGHYALSGNRNLMYFGDETLTDFTLEVFSRFSVVSTAIISPLSMIITRSQSFSISPTS